MFKMDDGNYLHAYEKNNRIVWEDDAFIGSY